MNVYLLSLSEAARVSSEFCSGCFPGRTERSARYRSDADRLRCIGAGALIAGIVGVRESGIILGEHGKPVSPGYPFYNISHSGDYIALVKDQSEAGVDIEVVNPSHISVAERVYLSEELEWMREDPVTRFFTLWTLKESVMKLLGTGFSLPPKAFSVMKLLHGESITQFGREIYAQTSFVNGHALSVCTRSPQESIRTVFVTADELERFVFASEPVS